MRTEADDLRRLLRTLERSLEGAEARMANAATAVDLAAEREHFNSLQRRARRIEAELRRIEG